MTEISVRGKMRSVPSFSIGDCVVVVKGQTLKTAEIFDEYWLEARRLPDPVEVLARCRIETAQPDLFTFAQRVPETAPRHHYFKDSDNVAVIPLTSYDEWFGKQVTSATRRNIRAAQNRGVVIRVAECDEAYVRGIMSIYDESPIRQGRQFWHYGKDFASVRAENGTYSERATFLAAYFQDEMIGYLKVVWDEQTAAIMQIMSKLSFYDKRPNNALLAEAVRQCCARGVKHLQYESFVYGNKTESSLTEFKRSNGFVRMDVPRYFVPLTTKGALALRLGLHRDQKDRLPGWLRSRLPELRTKWYRLTHRQPLAPAQGRASIAITPERQS
jgi:hypothetical protein